MSEPETAPDSIMEGALEPMPETLTRKDAERELRTRYQRVRYVAGLLLLGFRETEIAHLVSKNGKFHNVPSWYIRRDIVGIRKRWKLEGGPRLEKMRADALAHAHNGVVVALEALNQKYTPAAMGAYTKACEFYARVLGIDKGAPQINLTQVNNLVPLTQNDVTPDGRDAGIEWAPKERKQPPGMNRLLNADFSLEDDDG